MFDTIIQDLSGYDQENRAPRSFTIGKGKKFRHYELGECFGLVAYNEGHVFICEIKEDDDNWYCFTGSDKDYYDASWVKTKIELYTRMQNWLDENMTRNYYSGHNNKQGFECGYNKLKK